MHVGIRDLRLDRGEAEGDFSFMRIMRFWEEHVRSSVRNCVWDLESEFDSDVC